MIIGHVYPDEAKILIWDNGSPHYDCLRKNTTVWLIMFYAAWR